ncbi:MAG: HAMP domain-containing sensor histidine kinase [Actinomycetota bacterium]
MTLANRTALAAGACGLFAVVLTTVVGSLLFARSLSERVDDQLRERAQAAPVLAAVGARIGVSELAFLVEGARVDAGRGIVRLGSLPPSGLPPLTEPGWRTVRADGQAWRLLAVEVRDVPEAGDRALVEFVEPLGDVDAQLRLLRRRVVAVGALAAALVAALGLVAGRRAARPLTDLAAEVRALGTDDGTDRSVSIDRPTPEVEQIAKALDDSLGQLAAASRRREDALEAARSFAAAASHELRTPLQSAMLNLDLTLADRQLTQDADRRPTAGWSGRVETARAELGRLRSTLDAVRRLSEVDLVDAGSFETADLADVVDRAVGALAAEARDVSVELAGVETSVQWLWVDGVRLAVENLVRNALRHGRRRGEPTGDRIVVTIGADGTVTVDDAGAGIPAADRARIVRAFERGSTTEPGSGLGLAFVERVASVHGGSLHIGDSPLGGARLVLALGGSPRTES